VEYRARENNAEQTAPEVPQRLNKKKEQAERLRRYRSKDPALDAIAEALDLEVIE
jgi:hypothetical protein